MPSDTGCQIQLLPPTTKNKKMNKFQELGLSESLVQAVTALGFEQPTPIQEKAIPYLLTGDSDLVALAQTGTGKTAAFGLPIMSLTDFSTRKIQALVLCPTRELCLQISKDLQSFATYTPKAKITAVYGGASIVSQMSELKAGSQIVVATPGRMVDIINRKKIDLSEVQYLVLDEADEMLNMGFQEDLDFILSQTPKEKKTWLFSATMPKEVERIAGKYMNKPVELTTGRKNETNENIEHVYYITQARDRYPALKRIADFNPDIFAIVFCRTRVETQQIAEMLIKDGYNADAIHGDLSQAQRDHVMKRFRNRTLQMLVATDVAARGIDVSNVTHVINYNLPDELEVYTHRSGRTARAGKKGVSITLINMRETGKIKMLERMLKTKFTKLDIPSGMEVCEKQLLNLVTQVKDVTVSPEIETFIPSIMRELESLDREEVIRRFVSTEFNRFLEYYSNAPDLNASGSGDRGGRSNARLFVSLGELDGFDNDTIKSFIAQAGGVDQKSVVWADLKNSYSFIEVKEEASAQILQALGKQEYQGRKIKIERAEPRSDDRGGSGRYGRDRKKSSGRGGNFRGGNRESGGGNRGGGGRSYGGNREGGSRDGGGRSGGQRNKYKSRS